MALKNAEDLRLTIRVLKKDESHPQGAAAPITREIMEMFLDSDPALLDACKTVVLEELKCGICHQVPYYTIMAACCRRLYCYGCRSLCNREHKKCIDCRRTKNHTSYLARHELEHISIAVMERSHPGYTRERHGRMEEQSELYNDMID